MGAAFTSIVTSLVSDIITPVIGLAIQANLANKFVIMRCPFINGTTTQTDCKNTNNWNTILDGGCFFPFGSCLVVWKIADLL